MQPSDKQDPARISLEKNTATLENGRYALAFSSGLAACCAISRLLRCGDHILIADDLYGGSYYLIEGIVSNYGVSVTYVDTSDLVAIKNAIKPNTKLLWLESPSNPLLRLADLEATSRLAKKHKIITVVDNTLATPCLQKPLAFGADIVVHSSIKYLSGRTDIIAGAVVTNRLDLFKELQAHRNAFADAVEPTDCFAILKGMRTLSARAQQQEKSAKKVANFLSAHLSVQAVHYPGLPSHPQYKLACRQMSGFGNMLAFELKGGIDAATRLLREIRLFSLREKREDTGAESDHGLLLSSTIAHAKIPQPVLANNGANGAESLVRLTIGLDNTDDLINDLNIALLAIDRQLIEFPAAMQLRECI